MSEQEVKALEQDKVENGVKAVDTSASTEDQKAEEGVKAPVEGAKSTEAGADKKEDGKVGEKRKADE